MYVDFLQADEELVFEAERLGFDAVTLLLSLTDDHDYQDVLNELNSKIEGLEHQTGISIYSGLEIVTKNSNNLRKRSRKLKKHVNFLLVHGGDSKINRVACESPQVDILCHPYLGRRDSGINHILGRKAAENKVCVEFNVHYLLKNSPYRRFRVLKYFRDIIFLARKIKFPFILTSHASSIYDLHTPQDMMALTHCWGLSEKEACTALSRAPQEIIRRSNMRNDYVAEGIRILGKKD